MRGLSSKQGTSTVTVHLFGCLNQGARMTRFLDAGAAEWPVGEARFLHIWQLKDGHWKLTRVVSYEHM